MRILHLADNLCRNVCIGQRNLLCRPIPVHREMLRPNAHTHPEPRIAHDLEVSIVQLHPRIWRRSVRNHALHLRRNLGNLVRRAHITRFLRILLALEIPCNRALRIQQVQVLHGVPRLLQHLRLKIREPLRRPHIEIARIAVIEVPPRVVRISTRLGHIPLRRTRQVHRPDHPPITPVQLRRPRSRPALVRIRAQTCSRRSRRRESQRNGEAVRLPRCYRTICCTPWLPKLTFKLLCAIVLRSTAIAATAAAIRKPASALRLIGDCPQKSDQRKEVPPAARPAHPIRCLRHHPSAFAQGPSHLLGMT